MEKFLHCCVMLFVSALLFVSCSDDKTEMPKTDGSGEIDDSAPVVLAVPELIAKVKDKTAEITWKPVEHAAAYKWELIKEEEKLEQGKTIDGVVSQKNFAELKNGNYRFVICSLSSDSEKYIDSEFAECVFEINYTEPDPMPEKPIDTDAFVIEILRAATDGVEYKYTPKDKHMFYGDYWKASSLFGQMSDKEIISNILMLANNYLKECDYNLDYLVENGFVMRGDCTDKAYPAELGFSWQVGVVGFAYNDQKREFVQLTNLYKTDPFVVDQEESLLDEPWVAMQNPVCVMHEEQLMLQVELLPNEEAKGNVYGKVFPADYLKMHTEADVIGELLAAENMPRTKIADNDLFLRGVAQPKERYLFVVTTTYRSGRPSMKLNWMLLETPEKEGNCVRIVESATGEVAPPAVLFEASVDRIDGMKVYYTVRPADKEMYYHIGCAKQSDIDANGDDKTIETLLTEDIKRLMLIYDYSFSSLCTLDIIRQGNAGGEYDYLDEEFEAGDYSLCIFGVELQDDVVVATTPLTKVPFKIEGVAGPTVNCVYDIIDGTSYGYEGQPIVTFNFTMSNQCYSYKFATMFESGYFASQSKESIVVYFEDMVNVYSEQTGLGWVQLDDNKSVSLVFPQSVLGTELELIMVGYDIANLPGEPVMILIKFPASF